MRITAKPGNIANAGAFGASMLIAAVPGLEFRVNPGPKKASQIPIRTGTGLSARTPRSAEIHVTASRGFPTPHTLPPTPYPKPCFSNRKPEILESLLSPLKSTTAPVLIANFEPNSAPVFGAAQIKKNAAKFPEHAEAA
jgi:hypothetical protein